METVHHPKNILIADSLLCHSTFCSSTYVIITDLVHADFRNKLRDYLMKETVTVWTVNDKSY